jgi:hypothetical protein
MSVFGVKAEDNEACTAIRNAHSLIAGFSLFHRWLVRDESLSSECPSSAAVKDMDISQDNWLVCRS